MNTTPSRHPRRTSMYRLWVIACLLVPHVHFGQGQAPTTGTEFWLGFMHNFEGGAQALQVFVSAEHNTSGTISVPRMGWSEAFTVTAYETTVLDLPAWTEHTTSETVEDKGISIVTQDTVSVHAINFRTYSADASAVFPIQTIGTSYRTQGYRGFFQNTQIDYRSELLIVATADGTELEIVPSAATVGGRAAGEAFTVQLDAGQTFQMKAADGWGDLTGTLIEASAASGTCRPFAVFSGAQCARVPVSCTACDHLYNQNLPRSSWGSRYFLVPFAGAATYSYRILGDHASTALHINGTGPVNLAAGQVIDISGETAAVHIEGNKPFSVAQFMEGESCAGNGDPSFLLVNAEEQRIMDITFATVESDTIDQHYLNIVVRSNATGQVLLNGAPLAPTLFTPFPAHPTTSHASLPIDPGTHRLQCPVGLTAYVYGVGTWETYLYSAGSYASVPSYTAVDTECGNGPDGTTVLSAPIPLSDPYWSLEGAPEDTLHQGSTYTFTPWDQHVIVLTGTDPNSGCTVHFHFHVELLPPPTISIHAGESDCAGSPVAVHAHVEGPGTFSYTWSPAELFNDVHAPSPTVSPTGSVWVFLDAVSSDGCSRGMDSAFVAVNALHAPLLTGDMLPNVFTPNGDLVNDVFPGGSLEGDVHLVVHNRWGMVVYESTGGVLTSWNGRANGSDAVPEGVYFYTLEYRPHCPAPGQEQVVLKGHVQLLR